MLSRLGHSFFVADRSGFQTRGMDFSRDNRSCFAKFQLKRRGFETYALRAFRVKGSFSGGSHMCNYHEVLKSQDYPNKFLSQT